MFEPVSSRWHWPPLLIMHKIFLTVVALVAVSCGSAFAQEKLPQEQLKKIDALVAAYVDAKALDSVAIGIIEGDSQFVKGYGKLGKDDPRVPDGDTVYEIGSVSKVFTGILLADAINRGLVEADQPVDDLLPDGMTMPVSKKKPERKITLMHLSTHISGLPRMPDNFEPADPANPYADYSAETMFEFLKGHELSRKPGIAEEYSNLGVGLLGELMVRKQGTDYESLLRERISETLGMSSTSLTLTDDQKSRLAPPHAGVNLASSNWDFQALAGAGGIRSTINDMLKFAGANLSPPDNETGKAIELAFTQQRKSKGLNSLPMGFGWMINQSETRWHNGGTGGYHSMMFVSRKNKRALVVLCNTATPEVDQLASQIMASLSGQDVKPRKFRKEAEVSKDVLQRYVGKYKLNVTMSFDIALNEDETGLTVQLTGQPAFPMFPESETLWFLKVVKAEIEFTVDDEGNCTALTLNQNGMRQTAKKQ